MGSQAVPASTLQSEPIPGTEDDHEDLEDLPSMGRVFGALYCTSQVKEIPVAWEQKDTSRRPQHLHAKLS